jgi:SAM-dependent methyltransferase
MTTTQDHYQNHLGPIYSWTVGDLEAAFARSIAELEALDLPRLDAGTAVDLGAGFGLHAIPLAQRGYSVTAIDTCEPLLAELRARSAALPITCVNADMLAFGSYVHSTIDLVLCMGDTLTHLPDIASVESLIAQVAAALAKDGMFIATFRDYVSAPLQADQRFILVRGDEQRLLTCFLEYAAQLVTVHDLLYERHDGRWQQRVSSYRKLRLAPEWLISKLTDRGLAVRRTAGPGGMVQIVATKT